MNRDPRSALVLPRFGTVLWLATVLPSLAPAQEFNPPPPASDEAFPLNPMLVTATRTPEEPVNLPYVVDLITPFDLERKLPRTSPDALRELPSVMLQKTSQGQGSPYIRGFTGFRTLMLVDGIRLNNSTFRDGPNQYWNTVDAFSIDRFELVRGPSSVLYGSDAIGGTFSAMTVARQDYAVGYDWDPRVFYRYSSGEQSHIGRAGLTANAGEHFGLGAGATFKDFGNVRGGDDVGEQPETGYREVDGDAKVEWRPSENRRLVLAFQAVDLDDAWRTHATLYGIHWRGLDSGSDFHRIFDQDRQLAYLQYHATEMPGFAEAFHASVSYQAQNEREDRLRSDRRREYQGVDVDTLGLSFQLESPTPVGRFVYGADYYHDWVDSFYERYAADGSLQLTRLQGPVADDSMYDLVGAFVEDRISLLDERLEFILGGRYNYAAVDARKAQDPFTGAPAKFQDSWDTVVGSGRVLYRLDDDARWTVFGGLSQGFRAPNLSDLTRFDIARTGEMEIPTYDLDPEHFLSAEGGVKVRYGKVAAEAAYFHTWIDEMIVRVPTGATAPTGETIVNKANSGEGYVSGVEILGSYEFFENCTLWGNFTWMEGRVDTPMVAGGPIQTEPVSRIMPVTANLGLRWEHTSHRYWAEFITTVAGTQDLLSASDLRDTQRIPPGGTPGYETYGIRGGWRPCPNVSLTAAIENLSDADYRIHGSGVNEPGRNFIVAADLRF